MVVAYTTNYGRSDALAPQTSSGNVVQCLYAQFDITTVFVAADTFTVGYLPKGAVPVGGSFSAVDIDTGTESLDIDIGIAANGVDAVDTDFFMNGGIFTGDAPDDVDTTGAFTNFANVREFRGPFPVVQLGAKTRVTLLCNAIAQAGGTGKLVICIYYITPGAATS